MDCQEYQLTVIDVTAYIGLYYNYIIKYNSLCNANNSLFTRIGLCVVTIKNDDNIQFINIQTIHK